MKDYPPRKSSRGGNRDTTESNNARDDLRPQRVAGSATFVHLHIDLFDVLPALSNGARLAVFVCVGLFTPDPRGATVEDIVDHTGLSEPTVIKALRFLEKHGYVGRSALAGAGSPRPCYRALKYWFYRGPQQADVRSTIPPGIAVSAIERSSQKNFSPARKVFSAVAVDINTLPLGNNHQQQQHCAETRKFLRRRRFANRLCRAFQSALRLKSRENGARG